VEAAQRLDREPDLLAARVGEEAMEEAFCEKNEIYSIISAGQYLAKNVIYTSVNEFINE